MGLEIINVFIEVYVIIGKAIAAQIRSELKEEVAALKERHNLQPGLAVVLVGNRVDSSTYVRMKAKACEEVGIHSITLNLPETITEDELQAEGGVMLFLIRDEMSVNLTRCVFSHSTSS